MGTTTKHSSTETVFNSSYVFYEPWCTAAKMAGAKGGRCLSGAGQGGIEVRRNFSDISFLTLRHVIPRWDTQAGAKIAALVLGLGHGEARRLANGTASLLLQVSYFALRLPCISTTGAAFTPNPEAFAKADRVAE